MHIILPADRDAFVSAMDTITAWEIAVLSWDYRNDPLYVDFWDNASYDFSLGYSQDKSRWTLSAVSWYRKECDDGKIDRSTCTAVLVDPPHVREESILMILFRIFNEIRKTGQISVQKIDEIVGSVRFKEYLPAGSYLPELPENWLHLPVELDVGFSLCEEACLYSSIFKEYRRDSFRDVLKMLCGPRHSGIMIHHNLVVRDAIPFLGWDVDWPLSRQGKESPYKRKKVQGVLPWDYQPDQTLLSAYQSAQSYYDQPVVRLKVGGRNQREAISNWHRCAKALRKLKPQK